jgi:hypothetical protein
MAGSLRDQLSDAFTEVEEQQTPAPATGGDATTSEPAGNEAAGTTSAPTDRPGRTAGRARDESGRLLPGEAKKPSAAPSNPATPIRAPEQAVATGAADPKPLNRPSSWKKEMWPLWDKLAKGEALTPEEARLKAEYILQREGDFAKGVSTYKAEAENAKPILEAMTPFLPALQANNIQPAQWIKNLGTAHQTLAYGNRQQKLVMFSQLARDYGVELGEMFVKGQDGQIYMNPQLQQGQQAPAQQQQQAPDVRKTVQEILAQERALGEVEKMKSDTVRYPHFETVKATMAGLLQSGLATDYDSAYDAALRLPEHFHLFEAQQQQQREAEEAKAREAKARAADAARRNAVSPRTSTPTATATGASGKKGLRDQLTENFDSVSGGRV